MSLVKLRAVGDRKKSFVNNYWKIRVSGGGPWELIFFDGQDRKDVLRTYTRACQLQSVIRSANPKMGRVACWKTVAGYEHIPAALTADI